MLLDFECADEVNLLLQERLDSYKKYEILTANEIAERIHANPGKRVVFTLFFEKDENGEIRRDSLDVFSSISLKSYCEDRGKYLMLAFEGGDHGVISVGERRAAYMPSLAELKEAIQLLFGDFRFKRELFCVCG